MVIAIENLLPDAWLNYQNYFRSKFLKTSFLPPQWQRNLESGCAVTAECQKSCYSVSLQHLLRG